MWGQEEGPSRTEWLVRIVLFPHICTPSSRHLLSYPRLKYVKCILLLYYQFYMYNQYHYYKIFYWPSFKISGISMVEDYLIGVVRLWRSGRGGEQLKATLPLRSGAAIMCSDLNQCTVRLKVLTPFLYSTKTTYSCYTIQCLKQKGLGCSRENTNLGLRWWGEVLATTPDQWHPAHDPPPPHPSCFWHLHSVASAAETKVYTEHLSVHKEHQKFKTIIFWVVWAITKPSESNRQ